MPFVGSFAVLGVVFAVGCAHSSSHVDDVSQNAQGAQPSKPASANAANSKQHNASAEQDLSKYLRGIPGVFPVVGAHELVTQAWGKPLVLRIHTSDHDLLTQKLANTANASGMQTDDTDSNVVALRYTYPNMETNAVAAPSYLAPSYVVNFDKPEVQALKGSIVKKYGLTPSIDELVQSVRDHMKHSLYGGFERASTVARTQQGDCTEHSVLLVALLRSFDVPSRLMLGYLIPAEASGVAVGHMWVEAIDNNRWLPLDATLAEPPNLPYLLAQPMTNEGLGYTRALLAASMPITRMEVSAVGATN